MNKNRFISVIGHPVHLAALQTNLAKIRYGGRVIKRENLLRDIFCAAHNKLFAFDLASRECCGRRDLFWFSDHSLVEWGHNLFWQPIRYVKNKIYSDYAKRNMQGGFGVYYSCHIITHIMPAVPTVKLKIKISQYHAKLVEIFDFVKQLDPNAKRITIPPMQIGSEIVELTYFVTRINAWPFAL